MRSHPFVLGATVLLLSGAWLHELVRPAPVDARPRTSAAAATPAAAAEPAEVSPTAAATEAALAALGVHVREQSHPDALRLAFRAYYNYRAAHPQQLRKPYLYFVDYGLGNRTRRGYVFEMQRLELVEGPFAVAAGRGSRADESGVPIRFTNIKDSATSSLGLYLTQETYAFRGTAGGRRYGSIGLRLRGLSGRYNSAARARGIVVHGAPYVTRDRAGRSEGCPAMEEQRAQRLIPRIAHGSLVFLFSPRDDGWMRDGPWIRGSAAS